MKSKPKKINIGDVWSSNRFGDFKIIEKVNATNVLVGFIDTGFKVRVQSSQIRNGNIRDLLMPSICGVGFIGQGRYKSRGSKLDVDIYTVWVNMIKRCYSESLRKRYPTYAKCTVCEEWHNFQNFAEWFHSLGIDSLDGLYLDKDIKNPLSKTYSNKTCLFVGREVNNFTTDRGSLRGEYLIGVTKKPECKLYTARCHNPETGNRDNLGKFESELQAHLEWRKAKSRGASYLASVQSNVDIKDAILTWKHHLDSGLIHKYK